MPKKSKSVKDNGSYVFADFSQGLYFLDTPRSLGEQLYSLALVGGRNVWVEKGALVPQYGYIKNGQIPEDEKVMAVTKDSESSSAFFIVTNVGNVYLYTAAQGLKKYKTTLPEALDGTPIVAHRGNDMVIYANGTAYLFGDYYTESSNVVIDEDIALNIYSNYYSFTAPYESLDYYWNGKELSINGEDKITLSSVTVKDGTLKEIDSTKLAAYTNNYSFEFQLPITLDKVGAYNISQVGSEGYSAIKGTIRRNIKGEISGHIYAWVNYGKGNNFYMDLDFDNIIPDTYTIKFTGTSEGVVTLEMIDSSGNTVESVSDSSSSTEYTFIFGPLSDSTYKLPTGVQLSNIDETLQANEITYYVDDIELEYETESLVTVIAVPDGGETKTYSDNVTIEEKALHSIDLEYIPEETSSTDATGDSTTGSTEGTLITPELMEICVNRLFIVDTTGRIYYSQVGNIDSFDQSLGAGYFEGFYNDTSKTLSLDEFLDGVLICKQNGIYYLTLGDDSISIKKYSQIGQQYASDHVIVREKVYAYDSNSGSLVNAISMNVFGSLTVGKTVVPSDYMDAANHGLQDSRRVLCYNNEAGVFELYYGENLRNCFIIFPDDGTMFPREMDISMDYFIGFNQGVAGVSSAGLIIQDFKKGTIIEGLTAQANFEPIGLRDNRFICSSILEVTELNGIEFRVSANNTGYSSQYIYPNINRDEDRDLIPPMVYSNYKTNEINPYYELTSRWADKVSNVTRVGIPMSGRNGVSINFEFPKNLAFCLAAIRLPDFSQGE